MFRAKVKYRATKPYSAPPFPLSHAPQDSRVVTNALPGYRQARNYSCGFAAVLMVLRYFERDLCGEDLFKALGTARDGTGQSAIVRVLRAEGVRANIRYDADFERIATSIDRGKVMVGYLDDEEHWLVIYGYGLEPRRVFVADPEPGKPCEYLWKDYGGRLKRFAIVCSTAPKTAAATETDRARSAEPEAAVIPAQLSLDLGDSA